MTATSDLRIGELAARCGRSVHAIRWYDAQGLIPGVVRDAAGRRVFTHRHVQWLGLVDRLRDTGMSIAQIRAYAVLVAQGRSSLSRQREILAEHRERVAESIEAWQASLALIEAKLDFYAEWIATGQRPVSEFVARKDAAAARAAKSRAVARKANPKSGPVI
jgi:DNA-binding transcriptional MerR regulator